MLTFFQNMVSTTNAKSLRIFYLGLAIFDNLILILTILQEGIPYWFMGTTKDPAVYLPITAPIFTFSCAGNGLLTVLICIERFVMIMYPEKSKIWCSKQKTIFYICLASLTSLLLSIPGSFTYSWDENGKAKATDFLINFSTINLLGIFLLVAVMLTLSIIIAIKVSLQFLDIR